jgi:hypothetical protein
VRTASLNLIGRDANSLDAFYKELADPPPSNPYCRIGSQMLSLLPKLYDALAGKTVWAVTSHERLCLVPQEKPDFPWLVIIQAVSWGGFEIRYRLPDDEAPWAGAMVEGFALDEIKSSTW